MSTRHRWHGVQFEWRPASRYPDREWRKPGFLLFAGVPGLLIAVGLHRVHSRLNTWHRHDSWWVELTAYGPRRLHIRRLDGYRQARLHLHVPYRRTRYEDGSATWRHWKPFAAATVNIGHPHASRYVGWEWQDPHMCRQRCWQYRRAWRKIDAAGEAREIDDEF